MTYRANGRRVALTAAGTADAFRRILHGALPRP